MKKFILILTLIVSGCSEKENEQRISNNVLIPELVGELDVSESSGLISLQNHLVTHNDSGGDNSLYVINNNSAVSLSELILTNTTNIDWEDITSDSDYIYVGDFGNNNGDRENLAIYKIPIPNNIEVNQEIVNSEKISFKYNNQTSFISAPTNTNYDAEALAYYNDKLYLFSKNWNNQQTDIYEIPNSEGDYSVLKIGNINVEGLITGATYDSNSNSMILVGYNDFNPFIINLRNIQGINFAESSIKKYTINIPSGISPQIESICIFNDDIYLTSEVLFGLKASLFKININRLN
jgi:hypothetical protein|tara:strand:- start:257 stop:1138 length:882 start_codon:yes stop_codon:yes gene_type:complete